jgi:hypothetical protein
MDTITNVVSIWIGIVHLLPMYLLITVAGEFSYLLFSRHCILEGRVGWRYSQRG